MLKIMTLNLNFYVDKHGAWASRKELIGEVIRETNPDIITFQAVAKDPASEGGKDQAAQFSELFPKYRCHFFQAAQTNEKGIQEGSAIITSLLVAERSFLPMSKLKTEDPFERVLLRTRFDNINGGPLYIFNGHFSWVYEQAQLNIKEAFWYINRLNGKALLLGDLNTPPDSDLFKTFKDAGWTDVWSSLHPDKEGFTFESNKPFTRIDYVWANPEIKDAVKDIQILHKEKDGIRLSDHMGLLVTLDLKKQS